MNGECNFMNKIVLISCASKKKDYKTKAGDLYISPLFRYNLKFANSMNPDVIYILSAKYGLLNLNREISPYEKTLDKMSFFERKIWADSILFELEKVSNLEKDEFIFLAGNKYRKDLISKIKNYKIPLKGLGIGKQLKYLKTI